MIEKDFPTSSVSVEFVDTTIMNILSLLPEVSSEQILTVARVMPQIGVAGLQFDNNSIRHNKNIITTIATAYDFDYDQMFNTTSNSIRKKPKLAIVTSLDPEEINKSIETLDYYERPLIEVAIPCSDRSLETMLATKYATNFSHIIEDSFDRACELSMDNDNLSLGCSLVDAMDKANKPEFLGSIIDMALNLYSLEFIDFKDVMNHLDPFDTYDFFMNIFEMIHQSTNSEVIVSAEFNNDEGLALANSLYFIKSAVDFARNNKTTIHTRVKTNVSNLGGMLSGSDMFSLNLAMNNHLLADLDSDQELLRPAVDEDRIRMAVDIFRTLQLDVPITAPVIGYNALKRQIGRSVTSR